MSAKCESLDTIMARAVKAVYFNRMGSDYQFVSKPYLNEEVFRTCFATVAHRYGIIYHKGVSLLSQKQLDDRRRYALHYRSARRRMQRAISNLAKNELGRQQSTATPVLVSPPKMTNHRPEQLWLRGFAPIKPIPPHIKQKLDRLRGL